MLGLASGLAAALLGAAGDFPLVDKKWVYARSENFTLWSRSSATEAKKILSEFELVRAVFYQNFKYPVRRPSTVTIVSFANEQELKAYAPLRNGKPVEAWGVMLERADRPVIIMYPGEERRSTRQVVYHEFLHELIRAAEENPPAWIDEGLAEIFSSIETAGDQVVIGRPHPWRVAVLQQNKLLSLDTLFAVDHQSHYYGEGLDRNIFYSQSWALLHFWLFGQKSFSRDRAVDFLGAAATKGTDTAAAFQAAFGMDCPAMKRLLDGYVSGGRYGIAKMPKPPIPDEAAMEARAATRDQMEFVLADLQLRSRESGQGWLWMMDYARAQPSDPRPWEALGALALAQGNPDTAREKWEQALELGSTNPTVIYQHTLMETRRWFQRIDPDFRMPERLAATLRSRLLEQIERYPDQRSTVEALALVESAAAQPSVKNLNLVQRKFGGLTLEQKQRTLLAMAHIRIRLDDQATAKQMLDMFDQTTPHASLQWSAGKIRELLDAEESPVPVTESGKQSAQDKIPVRKNQIPVRIQIKPGPLAKP